MNTETFISNGWNVIDEEEFKQKILTVFERVSTRLIKTFGPYGYTTIIEKHGNYHITKDGWTVLKNIRFANPIDNNIMQMINEIAAQVVIKVGDGSTSAIVAANEMFKLLEKDSFIKTLRPKEFIDFLNDCVTQISNEILANATQIDKSAESDYKEIYDLAYISTNSNHQISEMIQDIYKQTQNPAIDYLTSKTNKTYYEIIDGYKLQYMTYIDNIFAANDEGVCTVKNPLFLMMNFKMEYIEDIKKIISFAAMIAQEKSRKLVIVAPFYDKLALEGIRRAVMGEFKERGSFSIIYTRTSSINNMSDTLYNDFAIMTGGSIITEGDLIDIEEPGENYNRDNYLNQLVEKSLGETGLVVIGKDYTTISDFTKRNNDMYTMLKNDANINFTNNLKKDMEKNIITTETFELKRRVAKLNCKMGVIHIGGTSELSKEANKDLVEDAIKACESAYHYGYNIGCNMAIVNTIYNIQKSAVYDNIDINHANLYGILLDAFISVYKKILSNKFCNNVKDPIILADNEITVEKILTESVEKRMCYDLLTDEFSDKIINPCYTDIEILKAASSIVALIISSNQYISIVIKEANN
jgi:chaperonin GroEL